MGLVQLSLPSNFSHPATLDADAHTLAMTIELHHFFILTGPGAPQADLLSGIGLIEGTCNDHPGQGTANRRFFFSNSTLELLYVRDSNEAENGCGSRLRFVERAADAKASPFGLIVKATTGSTAAPFPGWRYCPEYFQASQCFHVGDNSNLIEEPLCICMPLDLPLPEHQPQPQNSDKTVTEVVISVPVIRPSLPLEVIAECEGISLRLNEPHRLELVFNEEQEGQSKDMTPELPLVIRW